MIHYYYILFCAGIFSAVAFHPSPWFTGYSRETSSPTRRYYDPTTTPSHTDFIENLVQERHQARKMRDFVGKMRDFRGKCLFFWEESAIFRENPCNLF